MSFEMRFFAGLCVFVIALLTALRLTTLSVRAKHAGRRNTSISLFYLAMAIGYAGLSGCVFFEDIYWFFVKG